VSVISNITYQPIHTPLSYNLKSITSSYNDILMIPETCNTIAAVHNIYTFN